MKQIDGEQVKKSVKYLNKDFDLLMSMKYFMVTKMKVKDLKKIRKENGDDCSDLGPEVYQNRFVRYEVTAKGAYRKDKDGNSYISYFFKPIS